MSDLTFHYKNRPIIMIFVMLIGFVASAIFVYIGLYEENPELRLLGNRASGYEAVALIWFFAMFMAGVGIFGIYAFFSMLRTPRFITLGQDGFQAPKAPISKVMLDVPYADIQRINVEHIARNIIMTVHFEGGKVGIPRGYLRNRADFETLQDELNRRWAPYQTL